MHGWLCDVSIELRLNLRKVAKVVKSNRLGQKPGDLKESGDVVDLVDCARTSGAVASSSVTVNLHVYMGRSISTLTSRTRTHLIANGEFLIGVPLLSCRRHVRSFAAFLVARLLGLCLCLGLCLLAVPPQSLYANGSCCISLLHEPDGTGSKLICSTWS